MFYVLIDLQRLQLLHKHADHNVIVNLNHIEGTSIVTRVAPGDDEVAFAELTCTDIGTLYYNTTGVRLSPIYRASMVKAMLAVLERMPYSDVDPHEASAQALAIPWANQQHFKYVRGSMKPTIPQDLFMPEPIKVAPLPEDAAIAAKRPEFIPEVPTPPSVLEVYAGTPKTPAPPRAPRAPREPGGTPALPGEGTLTSRIYARCQEQLDMNKREGAAQVTPDAVRLAMAKTLIEEGVNPSTARRQTMEWMRSL